MTAPFGPPCVPREMVDVRVLRDGGRGVPEWVPGRELGGAAGPPSVRKGAWRLPEPLSSLALPQHAGVPSPSPSPARLSDCPRPLSHALTLGLEFRASGGAVRSGAGGPALIPQQFLL